MHRAWRLLYDAATRSADLAAALGRPAVGPKWWRAVQGRRGLIARYAAWAAAHRARDRPLLWIHAPSVGEGLQARPLLERLRSNRPDLQVAYTYYSPSAVSFASTLRPALADFTDYLPFDTAAAADDALDALAPTAVVFSKLDVWPVLVERAAARGIPLGLVSATLAASSSRRGPLVRALLHDAYARLDAVGAVSDADADRLADLGVRRAAITVTGDTRYDQVWTRARATESHPPPWLTTLRDDRLVLVAGSTWPSDESVLLDAVPSQLRLVIAPHEPTPAHLASIERWAAQANRTIRRLDAPDAHSADVVLVDRLGVLGDLYALADIAYVGGAFHAAGLHSVLEPAAFGAPVLFGPRYHASRDAELLLSAGAAHSVANQTELTDRLNAWTTDDAARRTAGARARDVVRQGLGAADRSVALVGRLLGS